MRNKGERGSATLLVVGSYMVIIAAMVAFMMNMENKKQVQNEEINKIMRNYGQNEQDMEKAYDRALKKKVDT